MAYGENRIAFIGYKLYTISKPCATLCAMEKTRPSKDIAQEATERKTREWILELVRIYASEAAPSNENEAWLRETWQDRTFPMTPEEFQELLSSYMFSKNVVEAIVRTEDHRFLQEVPIRHGQEFGFVTYNQASADNPFWVSPLIEGEVGRIDLPRARHEFRDTLDSDAAPSMQFHTHPNTIEAFCDVLRTGAPSLLPDRDTFSTNDLKDFRRVVQTENMAYIYAIGIKNRFQPGGKMVLISFNTVEGVINFDPKILETSTEAYKKTHADTPILIYQQAGLNAVTLDVDLNSSTPFDPRAVEDASRILTTRIVK